jgi:hypothetical protein
VRKTAFRSPNTNAFVERFIQTIQQECVILGQRHFDYLVAEWPNNVTRSGHIRRWTTKCLYRRRQSVGGRAELGCEGFSVESDWAGL